MTGSVLNIIIKLTALALAVLLWFNVITNKQYEHQLTLAVTDVELPVNLGLVTKLPDSLTVSVMAEGKKLLRSDWKKAGLRIKAGRLKRGINNLELSSETVSLVRSEEVNLLGLPGAQPVVVQLDRIDSVFVPVASRLAVLPEDGYMTIDGQGSVSPLLTQVIGPGLLLQQIDSIYTEQKILDGITESVHMTIRLEKPKDWDLVLGRDSATIEVAVDKIRQKQFEQIPVRIGRVRSGVRPIVDPDRVNVTVEGPASLIDSLGERQIVVSVTPSGDISDGYAVPQVVLPPNFTPVEVSPDSIRILISP